MSIAIQEISTDHGTTLMISGHVNSQTSARLEKTLIPLFQNVKTVRLDLGGVDYFSSAGIRVLMVGEKTARTRGATFRIANVRKDVMDVFEVTGLCNYLTFEPRES